MLAVVFASHIRHHTYTWLHMLTFHSSLYSDDIYEGFIHVKHNVRKIVANGTLMFWFFLRIGRERKRTWDPSAICLFPLNVLAPARTGPGTQNSSWISCMSLQGPSTWAISPCLPRHITREVDWKQNNGGSYCLSAMGWGVPHGVISNATTFAPSFL